MFCPTCGKPNPDDGTFCASCGNVFPGKKGLAAATVPPPRAAATIPPRPGVTPPVGEVKAGLFAGRFELQHVLGKGGMGVVYRAKDNELGEDIAIKLLQPQFTKDAHEVDRFKREILTARKITHPNVIRIHDYGTSGDEFFISMELLPGGTLADRIARGLTLAEARDIAIGVAEGLGAAHLKKVVHRDIKPHNVLFDEDGVPKLVDFGIARFATATRATRGFAGTPHYISPEQAKGEEATERSDIYSLGVLLFELFTGKLPFDADSLVALALKHAQEPPPPPRTIRPEIPVAIEAIVLKCLDKDPANRYATPQELAMDLRAVTITGARPPATFTAPAPPLRPTPAPIPVPRPTPAAAPPPVMPAPASLRGDVPPPGTPNPVFTPPARLPAEPPKSGCLVRGLVIGIAAVSVLCGGLGLLANLPELAGNAGDSTPLAFPAIDPDGDDDDDAITMAMRPLGTFTPPPVPGKGVAPNDIVHPSGWRFSPPSDAWTQVGSRDGMWKYRDLRGSITLWVMYFPDGSIEGIRAAGTGSPVVDPDTFAALYPSPGAALQDIRDGAGVAQDYEGFLGEQPLAGRAFSVPVSRGVVSVVGYGPADQSITTRIRVELLSIAIQSSSQ